MLPRASLTKWFTVKAPLYLQWGSGKTHPWNAKCLHAKGACNMNVSQSGVHESHKYAKLRAPRNFSRKGFLCFHWILKMVIFKRLRTVLQGSRTMSLFYECVLAILIYSIKMFSKLFFGNSATTAFWITNSSGVQWIYKVLSKKWTFKNRYQIGHLYLRGF